MEHHPPLHPQSLLVHGPRLRALARRLVHDDHEADDLVQETWMRAVERGPDGGTTPWLWLARVLRNLAFQDHRLNARRTERERDVARAEGGGDEGQRFGMHRELVAAIEALEEPYRQAILLRYFDTLPPRKIAARLGIPVKTVKTRLNRGIGLLRLALDRERGGREQWMAAMLPFARMGAWPWSLTPPAWKAGGALMLGTAAVLACTVLCWVRPGRSEDPAPVPLVALTLPDLGPANEATALEPQRKEDREPRAAILPAAAPTTAVPSGTSQALGSAGARGRVFGPDGSGLAGVHVVLLSNGESLPALSGAEGAFEIPFSEHAGTLMSQDPRFATVLAADVDPAAPEGESILVVAPAVTLAGVVLQDGDPEWPGASVQVRMEVPLSFRGRFPAVLDRSWANEWSTRTDEQGRFVLAGAPGLSCAELEAFAAGSGSGSVPVPEQGSTAIEIALEPASGFRSIRGPSVDVQGEVRHADGSLAPWTLVAAAGFVTRSNDQAQFQFRIQAESPVERQLVAVAAGEQAARFIPARDGNGIEQWPPYVTLTLGPPPLSIAGRVLGVDGEPLAGAPVWIEDLSFVASEMHGFVTLEHRMADREERWFCARTDADGHFDLGGLCERGYRLAAMDPETLQVVRAGPVPAGVRDETLAFAPAGLWERVSGRVLDRHGTPLDGLVIQPSIVTFQVDSPEGDRWFGEEYRQTVTTDDQGRFELLRVPREGVVLNVPQFLGLERVLDPGEDPLQVVIEVPHLCHLQIALAPGASPDGSLEVLGPDDQPLAFYVYGGSSVWRREAIDLGDPSEFAGGATPMLSVPDTAAAVVLRDAEGIEVRRVSVVLGDEPTSVQL